MDSLFSPAFGDVYQAYPSGAASEKDHNGTYWKKNVLFTGATGNLRMFENAVSETLE